MSEKKVTSRNVAIVLGIVCIILTFGLVEVIVNYTSKINDLNSQIQKLQTLLSVYDNLQTENAINYLSNFMFVPSIGLDREAPNVQPNTIWLTNDNFLVYVVLSKLGNSRATTIKQKLDFYGITGNGKVELFADRQVGAFRASNYYTVATIGSYTIKEEVLNGTVMPNFDKFADLCFLWSKNLLLSNNVSGALTYFNKGMSYWNGTGFLDWAFNESVKQGYPQFETYKIGLALWMARQLNQTTNGQIHLLDFTKMEGIIWKMQDPTNGGIHTGYTATFGTAGSDTNVETTAICLLYKLNVGAAQSIEVGAFYYGWYGIGGLNAGRHWNDSAKGIVVDQPLFNGYYDSLNITHVRKQVKLMANIGIDFVVISWWGSKSYEDNSTKTFIQADIAEGMPLNFCIMVENYTGMSSDFRTIYNYIWNTYVSLYPNVYFKLDNKPVLCWFSTITNPWLNDSRFYDRTVGQYNATIGAKNPHWIYYPELGDNKISVDGCITVSPRWDEHYLYLAGARPNDKRHDYNYTEGMYDKEWSWVINNKDRIKIVLICSWNEYHERTMIEPHYDISNPDAYLAYNKTFNYIKELRGL